MNVAERREHLWIDVHSHVYVETAYEQGSECAQAGAEQCVHRACVRVGGSLGGEQGHLGEQEPGFCHSFECGERTDTLSDSFAGSVPLLSCLYRTRLPLHSPLKSGDHENREGIQTEPGSGGWGGGGALSPSASASPEPGSQGTASPALSPTTPGHRESCGVRGFLGGSGGWHLCLHLPTSVSTEKVRSKGRRHADSEKDRGPNDQRQRLNRDPRVRQTGRQAEPVSPGT